MPPAATFHAQLASIMEVLANTAVAEICELVDSGYAVLQLEISRSRKENEVLRRKLRLMELRAARTAALRAAANGTGAAALLHASGRPRVQLLAGYEPRRLATPSDGAAPTRSSNQEAGPAADPGQETVLQTLSSGETTAVIKVEDDEDGDEDRDESWSQSEADRRFCCSEEVQAEKEASSSLVKQEAAADGDSGGVSWTSGEVSSTSTQHALNASQNPEAAAYDSLVFELQHVSQNPAANVSDDSGGGGFGFSRAEGAPPPAQQRDTAGQGAFIRRDGWRLQNRVCRDASGGKTFVCTFCGKTLACLKNLKTHMRVHTGEKPFVCALCGKRFSDSSNLKRHQSVHTGEKRYGCVHCGKRFAQSGSLKVHMSVHRDCKQFRCSFCGKTFTSGGHLRRHVASHAGDKRFASVTPPGRAELLTS